MRMPSSRAIALNINYEHTRGVRQITCADTKSHRENYCHFNEEKGQEIFAFFFFKGSFFPFLQNNEK